MEAIMSQPLYLGIAVLILAGILFSIVKKVMKLAFLLVLLFAVYLFWVFQSYEDPASAMEKHPEAGEETA